MLFSANNVIGSITICNECIMLFSDFGNDNNISGIEIKCVFDTTIDKLLLRLPDGFK
jgi:hypothetical protein